MCIPSQLMAACWNGLCGQMYKLWKSFYTLACPNRDRWIYYVYYKFAYTFVREVEIYKYIRVCANLAYYKYYKEKNTN